MTSGTQVCGLLACVGVALLSGSCSDTSATSAQDPSRLETSTSVSVSSSGLADSEEGEPSDISLASPIDEALATALSAAYSEDVIFGPTLAAGDWFSDSFSEAIAFRLPVDARLVGHGRGWITLDLERSERGAGGRIRIVEVVAMSSPDGPIPIGNIDSATEFDDITVSASGSVIAEERLITWRDLQIESWLIPEEFHQVCHNSGAGCVPALISEGGPVLIELDRYHRFVSQAFGDHKLIVVSTAEDLASTLLAEIAMEISASIITTDRTEDGSRRPLASIGLRADAIPAGRWFVEIDGVVVDLVLDSALDDIGVFGIQKSWFALTPSSGDNESAASVQVFQGFPQGVVLTEDIEDGPLSAAAFLAGMAQILTVASHGPSTIGGFDSVRFGLATSGDRTFACSAAERNDPDDDQGCVKWSVDGWHTHDLAADGNEEEVVEYHYVEDLGVIVEYAVVDIDGELLPGLSVQRILDELQFSAP